MEKAKKYLKLNKNKAALQKIVGYQWWQGYQHLKKTILSQTFYPFKKKEQGKKSKDLTGEKSFSSDAISLPSTNNVRSTVYTTYTFI